ncbi:unnamed protein product, partial [marine sediment metagenome]
LKTLTKKLKDKRIATVMNFDAPCLIVTKGLDIDKKFIEQAKHRKIPILRTSMSTTPFIHKLSAYLDYKLAPTKYVQGTLVDIYGVGVLFIGKPGTGKSECAMDLIERGHRFVADDLVKIVKRGNILIGSGAEKSDRLRHHIEIRGVGIINIFRIFGVKSVRLRKRIEVVPGVEVNPYPCRIGTARSFNPRATFSVSAAPPAHATLRLPRPISLLTLAKSGFLKNLKTEPIPLIALNITLVGKDELATFL